MIDQTGPISPAGNPETAQPAGNPETAQPAGSLETSKPAGRPEEGRAASPGDPFSGIFPELAGAAGVEAMLPERQPVPREQLLREAVSLMKECNDYVDGILPTDVRERGGSFVFSGEYFLREDGTPSEKTLAVFNVFRFLNQRLSRIYRLEERDSGESQS